MSAPSAAEVHAAFRAAMEWDGYRRVDRAFYLRPLADGVFAWVSAGRFSGRGLPYELAPRVGVRHERLEAVVSRLSDRAPGLEPTVATYFGYLTEHRSSSAVWPFDDAAAVDEHARGVVDAIRALGLPYMRLLTSLERVLVEAERDRIRGPQQVPVALALLGRREEARSSVDRRLEELRGRDDPAATDFRAFSVRLKEALRAGRLP